MSKLFILFPKPVSWQSQLERTVVTFIDGGLFSAPNSCSESFSKIQPFLYYFCWTYFIILIWSLYLRRSRGAVKCSLNHNLHYVQCSVLNTFRLKPDRCFSSCRRLFFEVKTCNQVVSDGACGCHFRTLPFQCPPPEKSYFLKCRIVRRISVAALPGTSSFDVE